MNFDIFNNIYIYFLINIRSDPYPYPSNIRSVFVSEKKTDTNMVLPLSEPYPIRFHPYAKDILVELKNLQISQFVFPKRF